MKLTVNSIGSHLRINNNTQHSYLQRNLYIYTVQVTIYYTIYYICVYCIIGPKHEE